MRYLLIAALLLFVAAAQAQVVNGDFEQVSASATLPPNWTLEGARLLPVGWSYNATLGGPVGLTEQAHGGKYALHFAASKQPAHLVGATFPVKPGQTWELSGWAREGKLDLAFYEYADKQWLRTTPSVASFTAKDAWTSGGGYHVVADPRVTALTVVAITDTGGVTVDDISVRQIELPGAAGPDIIVQNQGSRLTIASNATVKSLYDATLKQEVAIGSGRPLMRARIGTWSLPATAISRNGDLLTVTFGENKARAFIEVQTKPYAHVFIIRSVEPAALESLTLFDLLAPKREKVGGSIASTYDARSLMAIQALHYNGRQNVNAAADTVNFTCTYDLRLPMYRPQAVNGCAFLTCPTDQLFKAMGDVETAYGMPSPRLSGMPGKLSPDMKRSYLFICDLTEDNVDEVIAFGKRGRFGYILIVEHDWSHGGGTFAINEKNFPHGLEGLKATIAKLKRAGFKVGLHILTAGMVRNDPLVTPVPDDGIFIDMQAELAASVDEKADFIPVTTPPKGFPEHDEGYEGNGAFLRLDDEIVSYTSLKMEPPYGFVGCRRGALGSKPAAHKAAIPVKHLMMAYGLFLIDAHSDLLDRVAENVARTWNACDCDGIYFDGSERLQGDHSYYNARLQMAYYDKFKKKDIIAQGSSWSPYTWHLLSRTASADGFRDIKLYLDKRTPSFQWYFDNYMPLDIGWYGINPNIRPDDIEYVCSRALAFDSSVSVETTVQALNSVPQAKEMIDTIARWEELRLSRRVSPEIRKQLQAPGKEYRLAKVQGQDALVPVEYGAWGAWPAESQKPAETMVKNTRSTPATMELQIEIGGVAKAGPDYETAQPLELFEAAPPGESKPLDTNQYNPTTHGSRATSAGVTQEITLVTDDVKEGKSAASFKATSTLKSAAGWATFGRAFDPPIALKDYEYLGLWVKGDAHGEMLKVQLWDINHKPQDQYVRIDWEGWRFIELQRPEPPLLDYSKIVSLNFYFNAMPASSTSHVLLDGLKVLAKPAMMTGPTVRVNGSVLSFPVQVRQGDRIVVRGQDDVWLHPAGRGEKTPLQMTGQWPAGAQELTVAAEPTQLSSQIQFRGAMSWPAEAIVVK